MISHLWSSGVPSVCYGAEVWTAASNGLAETVLKSGIVDSTRDSALIGGMSAVN